MSTKSTTAERARPVAEPATMVLACLAAWAIPGAGHFWLGRVQKGAVFFVALLLMFVSGLWLEGRLLPFELSEPLAALGFLANNGMAVPSLVARSLDLGMGDVRAVTWEYGTCFLIVAGLLNMLVVLDVFDIAAGRK